MTPNNIVMMVLAIITTLLIPLIVFLVRGAIKWTNVETKLDHAIVELTHIAEDKDKVHNEIYRQMREDRAATDRRLRWLEEHLWNRSNKGNAA